MAILTRASKRQLVDYNEVVSLQGESKMICVNLGVLTILRQLVRSRGMWGSTYYTSLLDGDLYVPPTPGEFDVIDAIISEFLEESDMTTCSELSDTLDGLTDLITALTGGVSGGASCATGAQCAGPTEPPASPEQPGLPGEQQGDPPDGFDTWAEYETYKCAVATHIVDGLATDLQWIENADIVTMTATVLLAALFTPVPFDDVVALAAFILTLFVQGVFVAAIAFARDAVDNSFDELVCALYQSSDADDAKLKWGIEVDEAIDAETTAFYAGILKSFLRAFIGYAAINSLFEEDIPLRNTIPNGDCSGCTGCPETWIYGSGDIENGGTFSSGPVAAEHRIQFYAGPQQEAKITAIVGWTDAIGDPPNNWRAASTISADCSTHIFGLDVLDQVNPPALPFDMDCVVSVTIRSNTAFTIDWEVVGPGVNCP